MKPNSQSNEKVDGGGLLLGELGCKILTLVL